MHATNRALFQTARNAVKPGLLPDFPPVTHSNYSHLRDDIGSASVWRRGGPATCKRAANGRDQGSAGEQNGNPGDPMTPESGARGSKSCAGEYAPKPNPPWEAARTDS